MALTANQISAAAKQHHFENRPDYDDNYGFRHNITKIISF